MKGETNWTRLKSMTEKEIVAAAKADPDAQLLCAKELKGLKRVTPIKSKNNTPPTPHDHADQHPA